METERLSRTAERHMRIIFLHKMEIPGAKAHTIQILHTARALAELGADVDVYVAKLRKRIDEVFKYYGISPHSRLTIRRIPRAYRRFNRWRGNGFALYCLFVLRPYRHEKPILIVRDERLTLLMLKLSNLLHVRVVPDIHVLRSMKMNEVANNSEDTVKQVEIKQQAEDLRLLEKAIFTRARGIICVTDNLKRLISKNYQPSCNILVARNGTTLFEPLVSESFSFDILYVGQLYARKNPDIVIKALPHIDHAKCGIIGGTEPSDFQRLHTLARDLGVEDRLSFLGLIPHSRVLDFLPQARVLVLPLTDKIGNRYFTCPLKLLEYMNSGRPIVAADLPSTREILTHGHDALLFAPTDHEELANSIKKLLESPELAMKLGREARRKVIDFTWENRARKILAFLEALPESS